MQPSKKIVDRAFENGTIDRVGRLFSAAQILNAESAIIVDEASDLLERAGLQIGMLKKRHSDLLKCADRYFREFSELITDNESKHAMFKDMDEFNGMFRKWAGLDAEWKAKEVNE